MLPFDEYADKVVTAVDKLADAHSLEDLSSQSLCKDPEVWTTLNLTAPEVADKEKLSFFTAVFTEVLRRYTDAKQDDGQWLQRILIILDISIQISDHFTIPPLGMHVLKTILLECCEVDFVVSRFSEAFFSAGSAPRRSALTLNNRIVGKTKPGPALLQIGNELIPRLYRELEGNDIFSSKLRRFITGALDINEKLSLASDWSLNRRDGLIDGLVETNQWKNGAKDTAFFAYYDLQRSLVSRNIETMVRNLRDSGSTRASTPPQVDFPRLIMKLAKSLDSIASQTLGKRACDAEWALNEEDFKIQMQAPKNRLGVLFELDILIDFMLKFEQENVQIMEQKTGKPKQTSAFDSPFDGRNTKKRLADCSDVIGKLIPQEYHETLKAMRKSESVWTVMKVRQFSHVKLQDLQEACAKRKREDEETESFTKKKRYWAKMGTPGLSKVWATETGLEHTKTMVKDSRDELDEIEDGLYEANGKLEGAVDEEKEKLTRERDMLEWRKLRNARSNGGWMGFKE